MNEEGGESQRDSAQAAEDIKGPCKQTDDDMNNRTAMNGPTEHRKRHERVDLLPGCRQTCCCAPAAAARCPNHPSPPAHLKTPQTAPSQFVANQESNCSKTDTLRDSDLTARGFEWATHRPGNGQRLTSARRLEPRELVARELNITPTPPQHTTETKSSTKKPRARQEHENSVYRHGSFACHVRKPAVIRRCEGNQRQAIEA